MNTPRRFLDRINKIFRIYKIHLVHLENLVNPVKTYLGVSASLYLSGPLTSFASNTRCNGIAPCTPRPSGLLPVARIDVFNGKFASDSRTSNDPFAELK